MKKVLYVEDDLNLATTVKSILQMDDLNVVHVEKYDDALQQFEVFNPDIVLLDILLNDKKDGLDIAQEIRKRSKVPVLFISTLNEDRHLKRAFNIKDSDYIRKPFSITELLFRVKKILNHTNDDTSNNQYNLKRLTFIPSEKIIYIQGKPVYLSFLESAVLTILCENMNNYIERSEIICNIWNVGDYKIKEPSFNNIISKLRKILKVEEDLRIESGMKSKIRIAILK